jgi:hypothetical protein
MAKRLKGVPAIIDELTGDGRDMFEVAKEIMQGGWHASARDRLEALKFLADRRWGKPTETSVQVNLSPNSGSESIDMLSDAVLEKLARGEITLDEKSTRQLVTGTDDQASLRQDQGPPDYAEYTPVHPETDGAGEPPED